MPSYLCSARYCPEVLKEKGYCARHQHLGPQEESQRQKHYDAFRRDKRSKDFYSSSLWRSTRAWKLMHFPLCERCGKLAEAVHHKRPVKEVRDTEPRLLTADENLQSLCNGCHAIVEGERKRNEKTNKQNRNT